MFSVGLLPVITRPTRIHHMSATLIDHIFESNKTNRYIAGILLTSLSDHFPTFYIEECKTVKIAQKPFKTRIINEKTIPAYENILRTAPWGSIYKDDPKSSFDSFFEIINNAGDLAFPEVDVKPKNCSSFRNPWMSRGLLISSQSKNKLFRKKLSNPSPLNTNKFQTYNILFNKFKRNAKKMYYFKQFDLKKDNIKQTWTLIRDVIGTQSKKRENLPLFFKQNQSILNNPKDIADGFNDFFVGIGPQLAAEVGPANKSYKSYMKDSGTAFNFPSILEANILGVIKKFKPKTSAGIDCVSNKLLKRIAPLIIGPLHYLINLSLETGFVAQQIKISKVIPLYKIGSADKNNFSNYRPISILSSFAK